MAGETRRKFDRDFREGAVRLVGDFSGAGLDPVAPPGDDLLRDRRHPLALVPGGRDGHGGAAGGLLRGDGGAVEPLAREQVTRRRPGLQLSIRPSKISPGG